MNKREIYFSLGVIIALALGAVSLFFFSSKKTIDPTPSPVVILPLPMELPACLIDQVIGSGDTKVCDCQGRVEKDSSGIEFCRDVGQSGG